MRHGHPPEIAQQLWAATHGAVALELVDMCLVDDVTDMYDSLINTLLTGLRATPSLSGASRSARKK
jgi:hypothetical protein